MNLKYPSPDRLASIARWLASPDAMQHFADSLGPAVALVPAPGHAPSRPYGVSSSSELVAAMDREGLGKHRSWLQRVDRVEKSAWAASGNRPTVADHYRTIAVSGSPSLGLGRGRRITVVDDVVTTGATLYACVKRLETVHTGATVRAFAMVRTRGDLAQVETVLDPVSDGTITLESSGRTRREP